MPKKQISINLLSVHYNNSLTIQQMNANTWNRYEGKFSKWLRRKREQPPAERDPRKIVVERENIGLVVVV